MPERDSHRSDRPNRNVQYTVTPQEASYLRGKFYNPYTFIPFHDKENQLKRLDFTPKSAGDTDKDRNSGVLELEVTLESPLLIRAETFDNTSGHKNYDVLCIGKDVIVPRSSIKGFLRYLMTIATGSPLSSVNKDKLIYYGRDNTANDGNYFLGRIIEVGTDKKNGEILLGETKRFSVDDNFEIDRPTTSDNKLFSKLPEGEADTISKIMTSRTPVGDNGERFEWELKLSGRQVGNKPKKEGLFKPFSDQRSVTVESRIWKEYTDLNITGSRTQLKKDDLIWIKTTAESEDQINSSNIVKIQWARWGRDGVRTSELIPEDMFPDSINPDKMVSHVSNMFGQIYNNECTLSNDSDSKVEPTFAGRIYPENLVFPEGVNNCTDQSVIFPPLSSPHPGCIPFYRNPENNLFKKNSKFKGIKVYRTRTEFCPLSKDPDTANPFIQENLETAKEDVNFSAKFLNPNTKKGVLRIAFRDLSKFEIGLLLKCCNTVWRLGGAKPFGFGVCNVKPIVLYNEDMENKDRESGEDYIEAHNLSLIAPTENRIIEKNLQFWAETQKPVENIKYPSARSNSGNKDIEGGHFWFANNAKLKMSEEYARLQSLYVIHSNSEIYEIPGQGLSDFIPGLV